MPVWWMSFYLHLLQSDFLAPHTPRALSILLLLLQVCAGGSGSIVICKSLNCQMPCMPFAGAGVEGEGGRRKCAAMRTRNTYIVRFHVITKFLLPDMTDMTSIERSFLQVLISLSMETTALLLFGTVAACIAISIISGLLAIIRLRQQHLSDWLGCQTARLRRHSTREIKISCLWAGVICGPGTLALAALHVSYGLGSMRCAFYFL